MHRGIIGRDGLPLTHNGSYMGSPLFDVTELDIKSPTVDGDLDSWYAWSDGSRLFWKDSYEFDFNTSTWKKKRFVFPPYELSQYSSTSTGRSIWTDGTNIYLSGGGYSMGLQMGRQYVLNGNKWEDKTWYVQDSNHSIVPYYMLYGYRIWTDGDNIYHSPYSTSNYVLDKQTSTWYPVTFTINASGQYNTSGDRIWTDGTDIYASYFSNNLVLNKQTREWTPVSFTGGPSQIDPYGVWHTANNTYVSTYNGDTYRLDKTTKEWTLMDWDLPISYYQYTLPWVFGGRVHTSANGGYDLDPTETAWIKSETIKHDVLVDSEHMWTDGKGIYISNGDGKTYQYDKKANTLTDTGSDATVYGQYVWSDGINTYYSDGNIQLQFDPNTFTWEEKPWNGTPPDYGVNVWTDGEHIYYTSGQTYVLDPSTSTWTQHQWESGSYSPSRGYYIWKQGDRVFYSSDSYGDDYELDIAANTWRHVDIKWSDWKQSPHVIRGQYVFVLNGHSYSTDWISMEELQTSKMRWTMILPYEHGFDDTRIVMGNKVFVVGKEAYYFFGSTQLLIK